LNHDAITFAEVLRQEKGYYTGNVCIASFIIYHSEMIQTNLMFRFVFIEKGYYGKWHLDGKLNNTFTDQGKELLQYSMSQQFTYYFTIVKKAN
jgi:hypothetical protein